MSKASEWRERAKERPAFFVSDGFRAKINDDGAVDFTCSVKQREIDPADWLRFATWLRDTLGNDR